MKHFRDFGRAFDQNEASFLPALFWYLFSIISIISNGLVVTK